MIQRFGSLLWALVYSYMAGVITFALYSLGRSPGPQGAVLGSATGSFVVMCFIGKRFKPEQVKSWRYLIWVPVFTSALLVGVVIWRVI